MSDKIKVTYEDRAYTLDTQACINAGLLDTCGAIAVGFMKPEEVFYKVGDRFVFNDINDESGMYCHGDEYILASADFLKIALISLKNGDRWANSVKCKDPTEISSKEFEPACRTFAKYFVKLPELAAKRKNKTAQQYNKERMKNR